MINQHEWLRTRKRLLDQVKSQVQVRLGPMNPALRRYATDLERDFRKSWLPCREAEVRRALNRARVVLSADFHAYSQSQRAHMRLLRDHIFHNPVILLLECLPHDCDEAVESFVSGRISERKFLELVNWEESWGFPWENYRPLLELARDRGFQVRGLNHRKMDSLSRRDDWTSRRIRALRKELPDALLYVVIGEWHLASSHLPKKLNRCCPGPDELMVIFQDVESLYFKLASQRKENQVEFLRSRGNRFCFMISPPWMKWQSYLMYLEQTYDRDLQEEIAIDYSDHVTSLVELLENDLGIETIKSRVQVYCPSSKQPLARLRLSLPRRFAKALKYHLEHDVSFFIPERDWLYLSRATINHASALAGEFVHAHLCHRRRTLWDVPRDFLPLVWVEAVSFFFSKWINPKRKAETLGSIRLQLLARQPRDCGRKSLLLALDHRLSEVVWVQTGRLRRLRYKPREMEPYLEAARIVGGMLGERLFQKLRSGTIALPQLMSYLRINVESREFPDFYWNLIRELEHDQTL
ncbi:MAG: ChaN family lipoprotein [Bdellovibrionales bacterium]